MDPIPLIALLLSVIAAYLAINAQLSKDEQDAARQLMAAQHSLGKTGRELLSALAKGVARKWKRHVPGVRDEVMTHVTERGRDPLYTVTPPVRSVLVHVLSDGSRLERIDEDLPHRVPETADDQLPEVAGALGKPPEIKQPRRYWFGKQRYEIAAYGFVVAVSLAVMLNTILPILVGSQGPSYERVMIFIPAGIAGAVLFFVASHMLGWETFDYIVGRIRGKKPFTVHEFFIYGGAVTLFAGIIGLVFTSTFPRLGEYGILLTMSGAFLFAAGFIMKSAAMKSWWKREWLRGRAPKELPPPPLPPPPPPEDGPSVRRARIMLMLHEGKTKSFIHKELHTSRPNVVHQAKRLLDGGFLERVGDGYRLTAKGRQHVQRFLPGEGMSG